MTLQPGKQITKVHKLSNISKSINNQTMKFVQLIEYNMINIFFEKLFTKWVRKTIPGPLFKKLKLCNLWISSLDQ